MVDVYGSVYADDDTNLLDVARRCSPENIKVDILRTMISEIVKQHGKLPIFLVFFNHGRTS